MSNPTELDSDIAVMQTLLQRQKTAHLQEGAPSLELRYDRLDRLDALLAGNADKLAQAMSEDFGSRSRQASQLYDVLALRQSIQHCRAHLPQWLQSEHHDAPYPGAELRVDFQPKGVVGVVSPWNFPVQLALGPVVCILGAGNRAILKPSELTPSTSALMQQLIAASFDQTELAVVTGGPDIGVAFTQLAFDHLIFTGGTSVGRHVARAAADNLVPLTLELGGKSPAIIGSSADLHQAVGRIMAAKTVNAGQICIAPDYVLIPRGQEDAFVAEAGAAVTAMFPTLKDNPDYTSIINQRHFARINGLVDDARAKGARVVEINPAQEDFSEPSLHRIAPTLVLDTTPDMDIVHEEIFGPVLPVLAYDSIEQAIAYINARPRPLALYYFGKDEAEERRVLQSTTSGAVTVNDCLSHVAAEDLPFGGIGDSGMGAYHGRYGFLTFSHAKAIYRQAEAPPAEALLRPPYAQPIKQFLAQALGQTGQ